MSAVLLTARPVDWECPNCPATDRTTVRDNRWHRCAGLAGLLAPLVPAGSGARVFPVEREDYVGREVVTLDGNGRPVAAVVTERPDGSNDVLANADAARGGIG